MCGIMCGILTFDRYIRAHKAAHPEKYPVVEAAIKMYPKLEGIEKRHKPTQVHLQVYDGT